MRIYGYGAIVHPASGKVAWDFEDGPLETEDVALIAEAKRRGFSKRPPEPPKATAPKRETEEIDTEELIEHARVLGIGAPSVLRRWGVERLQREIAKSEAKR